MRIGFSRSLRAVLEQNAAREIPMRTAADAVGDATKHRPRCRGRAAARVLVASARGTGFRSKTRFEAPAPARVIAPDRNHSCRYSESRVFHAGTLCGSFQYEVHRRCAFALTRKHDLLIEAPLEFFGQRKVMRIRPIPLQRLVDRERTRLGDFLDYEVLSRNAFVHARNDVVLVRRTTDREWHLENPDL